MHPSHKEQLQKKRRYFPYFFSGVGGGIDKINADEEHKKRQRFNATDIVVSPVSPAAPVVPFIAPPQEKPRVVIDRLHKWSSHYVFVANDHNRDEDPIMNPAYKSDAAIFSSVNDGYTFAKAQAALLTDGGRVTLYILGGKYTENIVCNNDNVDIVGLGTPTIKGKITITSACQNILVQNLRLYNSYTEGDLYDCCLRIDPGAESGQHYSNITIENVHCTVNYMCADIERWSYFKDCRFTQLYDASNFNSYPAVRVRLSTSVVQTRWNIFERCEFLAPKKPSSEYFDRGYALEITAIDSGGDWHDSTGIGVLLDNCKVTGWTSNYGWTLWCLEYSGTDGYKINTTSGAVHHRMFCKSYSESEWFDAATYFDNGRVGCRYLAEVNDLPRVSVTGARTTVYTSQFAHEGPFESIPGLRAGTAVHNSFAGITPATVVVNCASSHTGANFFYAIAGPVEGANITANCNANINAAIPVNRYHDI